MKFLHMADLHIGKRVNEYSMLEDQAYILHQVLQVIEEEKPTCIVVAGDVYDKPQPSGEAVELLDEFLTQLVNTGIPVFIISGNHDSPERLSFGSRILKQKDLYIAGSFHGELDKKTMEDEYGKVNIYMLPFVKPAQVKPYYDKDIESYQDAVNVIIKHEVINKQERNVLIAHQFVVSEGQKPEQSESEIGAVGGLDCVDASLFADFDYVALGHLHGPQRIGQDYIRYAGSPLKYSFSEVRQRKSVTIVELKGKNEFTYRLIPLIPKRDMREIRGPLEQLISVQENEKELCEDYIRAIITNEEDVYDGMGQLRAVYPNIMSMVVDNSRTMKKDGELGKDMDFETKDPMAMYAEFYQMQNQSALSEEETVIMERIWREVEESGR